VELLELEQGRSELIAICPAAGSWSKRCAVAAFAALRPGG